MHRRFVQKLEFYITNVCNLTCHNCNRFNDHDFRGWQRWSDYEADYREWGRRLSVEGLVILGGEPLLNPTVLDWIRGINLAFDQGAQVLTNGTRLNHVRGLYETLASYRGSVSNWIGISVHNMNDLDRYMQEAEKFLSGKVRIYRGKDCKGSQGEPISFGADYTLIDENSIAVRLWLQDNFWPASIRRQPPTWQEGKLVPGRLTLWNNDPERAHEACGFAQWKNYHMIRGRLHKCGPCVLMADFDRQQPLDISDEDREILNSYQPLSVWDYDAKADDFFAKIDDVLPQCKFCPVQEQMHSEKIFATLKTSGSESTFARRE